MRKNSGTGPVEQLIIATELRRAMPRFTDSEIAYLEALRAKYTSTDKGLANDQIYGRFSGARYALFG